LVSAKCFSHRLDINNCDLLASGVQEDTSALDWKIS